MLVSIAFEINRFVGRYDNWFTSILTAPGLWMQRLTTHEPDEDQLRVAIMALKCAMPDTFDRNEVNAELEAMKPKKDEDDGENEAESPKDEDDQK